MNKTVSIVRIMLTKKVEHLGDIDSKLDDITEELEDLGYEVSVEEVEDDHSTEGRPVRPHRSGGGQVLPRLFDDDG